MRKERMPIVLGDIEVKNMLKLKDGNVISLGPDKPSAPIPIYCPTTTYHL